MKLYLVLLKFLFILDYIIYIWFIIFYNFFIYKAKNIEEGIYSFRHTFTTKVYRKLRETFTPEETESKLMLITGHSTRSALRKYLREIDAERPDDYSDLLK